MWFISAREIPPGAVSQSIVGRGLAGLEFGTRRLYVESGVGDLGVRRPVSEEEEVEPLLDAPEVFMPAIALL